MRIGAAGDDREAGCLKRCGEGLRVLDDGARIGRKARLQRLAQRHRLGGDDMHQGAALEARKHRRIDPPGDVGIIREDHPAARPPQRLVRRGGDDMGVG